MVPGLPAVSCRCLALTGALLVLACGHSEPFSGPSTGTTSPFDPTPPVRLTLNEGADRGASWLPDGSGILYSAHETGRRDRDLCLAELPPSGGTQRRLVCDLSSLGGDSTNAIESPVTAPDGRLAFVKAASAIGALAPTRQAVAIGIGGDPVGAADVQPVPFSLPGEPRYTTVRQLRWQSASRLVFVASQLLQRVPCMFCQYDTIVSGLDVGVLDLSPGGASASVLPGTDLATGVSPGITEDEVYFTLAGDTRIYRRTLSSGATDVVYDFGAAGVARDVHVSAGRLAAVVGGRTAFSVDPDLGPTQWDSGGIVHVVTLSSGADVALEGPGLFRRPALSPDGTQVVAEGYPLIITEIRDPVTGGLIEVDTTVDRVGDLYLFGAP